MRQAQRERERERERKRRRVTVREPVTCIPGTFAGFFSTWLTASTSSPSTFFTTIHHLPPLHAPRKPRLDYFGPVRALYISFLRRLLAGELLVPWDFMRTRETRWWGFRSGYSLEDEQKRWQRVEEEVYDVCAIVGGVSVHNRRNCDVFCILLVVRRAES